MDIQGWMNIFVYTDSFEQIDYISWKNEKFHLYFMKYTENKLL